MVSPGAVSGPEHGVRAVAGVPSVGDGGGQEVCEVDSGGGGKEGLPAGEGGGLLGEQEAGAQPHSGILNMSTSVNKNE